MADNLYCKNTFNKRSGMFEEVEDDEDDEMFGTSF